MKHSILLMGLAAIAGVAATLSTPTSVQASSGMKKYEISIQTKENKRITDSVSATSKFDAESIMKSRYPGCVIWSTKEVK